MTEAPLSNASEKGGQGGALGAFVGSEGLKLRDVKWATQGPPARGRAGGRDAPAVSAGTLSQRLAVT